MKNKNCMRIGECFENLGIVEVELRIFLTNTGLFSI